MLEERDKGNEGVGEGRVEAGGRVGLFAGGFGKVGQAPGMSGEVRTWCLIREKDEPSSVFAVSSNSEFRSWAQDNPVVLNPKYNISLYCLCLLPCPMPKFCKLLFPLYLLFEPPETPHHTMIARRSQIFVLPVIHCHGVYIAQP